MCDGRLEVIIGPMFAGKTTELMRRVNREKYARLDCFIVKYANDDRYSETCVATHDQRTLEACAAVSKLSEVGDKWKDFDCIAIDEGQFFPDLVDFCSTAADAGKIVYVSALDGDFQRKPFGHVCDLITRAENVTKLHAVCMLCHSHGAAFTRRTVNSTEQELIGGAEMYIAVCRKCYNARDVERTPRKKVRCPLAEIESANNSEPVAKKVGGMSPP